MSRAMEMLDDLWRCVIYRADIPTIFERPISSYLAQVIDLLKEENKSIERVVRDAICSYEESFPGAPNDDCELELKERAEIANKWLIDHGFEPEKLTLNKEEVPCL